MKGLLSIVRGAVRLIGGNSPYYAADVVQDAGNNLLRVLAQVNVQVSELLGKVVYPYTKFTVTAAPLNSTFQIKIDDDSIDVTTTITATEAGNPKLAAGLIVSDLNDDSTFKALYLAFTPDDIACPKVFMKSLLAGDCNERADNDDLEVIVAGGAARTIDTGFDKIVQRATPISTYQHPKDPDYSTLGVYGDMTVVNKEIDDYFSEKLTNVTHGADMTQDGSSTPIEYKVEPAAGKEVLIKEIRLSGEDGNIIFSKFFDMAPLTNGLQLIIKSKGQIITFSPVFKTTNDIVLLFNYGGLDTFIHLSKRLVCTFKPTRPIRLRSSDSDYVMFKVQDNLGGLVALESSVKGDEV